MPILRRRSVPVCPDLRRNISRMQEDPFMEGVSILQHQPESEQPRRGKRPMDIILRIASDSFSSIAEPLDYFSYGHYRGAVVFSAAAIETTLRGRYPEEKSFYAMITRARKDGLLRPEDLEALASIRTARNSFVHELNVEVDRVAAERMLRDAIDILDRLVTPATRPPEGK